MTVYSKDSRGTEFQLAQDTVASNVYEKIKLAFGIDGTATDVSSGNPFPVSIGAIAAADRTTDSISAASQTGVIMLGLSPLTVKYKFANIASATTDGAVVAAVTSKKIRVVSFRLHAGNTATNCTFTTKPVGAGSAISELFAVAANSGRAEAAHQWGHFETNAGEGLSLTTGTGSSVGVGVVYIEV